MLNLLSRTRVHNRIGTKKGLLGMLNLLSRTLSPYRSIWSLRLLGMLNLLSRTPFMKKINGILMFARYVKFIK